jgi:hypothetical protein
MAWQCTSLEQSVKGFKRCCMCNVIGGTDDSMLWKGSEEEGNVRNECEEEKALFVKNLTVTVIGKGRQNLTNLYIKCMKLIAKYIS